MRPRYRLPSVIYCSRLRPLTPPSTARLLRSPPPRSVSLIGFCFSSPRLVNRRYRDVCASATTGSGKTAAFLLPILERLLYRPKKIAVTRVMIITPTRYVRVFFVRVVLCNDIPFPVHTLPYPTLPYLTLSYRIASHPFTFDPSLTIDSRHSPSTDG